LTLVTYAASIYGTATVTGVTSPATFTLGGKQAPLTVTANPATAGFGQPLPLFTCTLSGFVLGDTPTSATTGACAVTTTAKQGSPVDTYKLVPSKGTLAAPNYTFGPFVDGTLTIVDAASSPTPVISPTGGIYTSFQIVAITDTATGSTIYYTTDGTTPSSASTRYKGPFLVDSSETVKATAVLPDHSNSSTAYAAYNIVGSPFALAGAASGITNTDATLNAEISTSGLAGSYYFQYGTSSNELTSNSPKTALDASTGLLAVSKRLTTLTAKTTYYYQVVVTTAGGSASSAVVSFTTN
jgi:hypothetical protein